MCGEEEGELEVLLGVGARMVRGTLKGTKGQRQGTFSGGTGHAVM
jgi:hypothetical protein